MKFPKNKPKSLLVCIVLRDGTELIMVSETHNIDETIFRFRQLGYQEDQIEYIYKVNFD